MQLRPKRERKVGRFILQASLALFCSANSAGASDQQEKVSEPSSYFTQASQNQKKWAHWSGELGFLGYSETEGRVQALEPAIEMRALFDDEKEWSIKLVLDSLTGASPNGALKSSQPQVFTTPSGGSTYQTSPGEIPLDSSFRDTRVSLSSSWLRPVSRLWKLNYGLNISNEYDYLSTGANLSATKDSEDKNSTYMMGISYVYDTIDPVGGAPIPLSTMVAPSSPQPKESGAQKKESTDLLFGWTQVMSRTWIVQTNLSLGYSSGYMTDPYKIVTVFDGTLGATYGDPTSYIYESRPDEKIKQSIYFSSKKYLNSKVLTMSYRYYFDDWKVASHTIQGGVIFPISNKWQMEPSLRVYLQEQAEFYDYAISDSETIPRYVSADNRLGEFMAFTPGVKFVRSFENKKRLNIIFQVYTQKGDSSPSDAVGSQRSNDLFPDVTAYIVQTNYIF